MTDEPAPRDLIPLAICAGLVAASGELAVLAIQKFAFHDVLRLSPHVIWMAPLNEAVLFGAAGIVLALLVAATRRAQPARAAAVRRGAVFVCAFGAVFAVALGIPRIHKVALALLAVGAAVQITRLIESAPRAVVMARRTALALTTAYLLAGVALGGWRMVRERRAIAALPPAAAGAQNVLLIIWDTVRSASLSTYGYGRPTTPRLGSLAARGVTFDWAFATAPWTLASHASFFTGRMPYDLTADVRTPLDGTYPTVAERLRADGFLTAGFVANGYYCDLENGLGRGFLHYEDFVISPGEIFLATTFGRALSASPRVRKLVGYYDVIARRSADDISASFLRWVDHRPARPFFAFLNYYDAHLPYLPPEPWRSRFGPQGAADLSRLDHSRIRTAELFGRSSLTAAQKQELLDAYDGGIAYLDDRLGLLLDSLNRRGLLRNTVVIVASDHGEHFGEHPGIYGHNRTLFTQEIRVPLVIHAPGEASAPVHVPAAVTLRDLPATILDLAQVPPDASLPGRSLSRYWRQAPIGEAAEPDTVLAQYAQLGLRAVATGRYQLVIGPRDQVRLFDFIADPSELHDLAESPEGAARAASIGAAYRTALAAKPRHPPDNAGPRP